MASAFDDMNDVLFTEDMGAVSVVYTTKEGVSGSVMFLPERTPMALLEDADASVERTLIGSLRMDQLGTLFGRGPRPQDRMVYGGESWVLVSLGNNSDEFAAQVVLGLDRKVEAFADAGDRERRRG